MYVLWKINPLLTQDRIGTQPDNIADKDIPHDFPEDFDNISKPHHVPFSQSNFELLVKEWNLPQATSWLLQTSSSHFQTYCLNVGSGTEIGMERTGHPSKVKSR